MTAQGTSPTPNEVLDYLGSLIGSVVGGVGEIVDVGTGRGSDVIVTTSDNGTHTAGGGVDDTGEPVVYFIPADQGPSIDSSGLLLIGGALVGAYFLTN